MPDVAALLLVVFFGCVGPAIIITAMILRHRQRALIHRERIAAIEKGIEPPPLVPDGKAAVSAPWTPQQYLLRGMMWLFAGIAIAITVGAISATSGRPVSTEEKIRMANNARAMGAKDDEIQRLWNDQSLRESGPPEGAAAVGLIPAGIGLAYLIFYAMERKKQAL